MGAHQGLAAAEQRAVDPAGIELVEAQLERPLRTIEPDHRGVVADTRQRRVDRRLADALLGGQTFESLQPRVEALAAVAALQRGRGVWVERPESQP